MAVAQGAIAGLVAGLLAGAVVAVLLLAARRWRNGHLIARGGLPYRDCALVPLWWPGAVVGALAGALAGGLGHAWRGAALAGSAAPALILVVTGAVIIRQAFARVP